MEGIISDVVLFSREEEGRFAIGQKENIWYYNNVIYKLCLDEGKYSTLRMGDI